MNSIVESVRPRRGRPRKFLGRSSAVTLTLPEEVLAALRSVDTDLSRAVVRLAQPELAKRPHPPAELVVFGRKAVIVVNPTHTLEERTGVSLVPLPDGRALISFDQPLTIAQLELMLTDAVEDRLAGADQQVFETIADLLRTARRSNGVVLRQRSIIVLEAVRPSQLDGSRRPAAVARIRGKRKPVKK
ncbi:MAG: hypothetical protein ACRD1S_18885 [Vicinamibacterales bacterium]